MAIMNPKKPAYFSKEARAAREAALQQTTETVEATVAPAKVEKAVDPMQAILARMEAQDRKIKELESRGDLSQNIKDAKEIYKGPRNYAFSLRGGVPVLSRKSKRMDETKDLQFKNQFGQRESNHALVLELQDGTTKEVEVTLFNRDRTKTEPMPAKTNVNEDTGDTSYTFNTEEFGKVVILSSKYLN